MTLRHVALLWAAVALAYANALSGPFQYDDWNVIVNNPSVHDWTAWRERFPLGIRPVLSLSYLANWLWEWGAFGFHLTNLAIHAVNAALVLYLADAFAARTLPRPGLAPLAVALLFAVHPVQTEAVTYISGRSGGLAATFFLGALASYVRGWRHVASPLLFVLAVATKETAVTLPPTLLLWEIAAGDGWRAALRRQGMHWALLAAMLAGLAAHATYGRLLAFGFTERGPVDNLMAQAEGVSYLLSRLVLVHRLSIDPDLPVPVAWTPRLALQAVALLALLGFGLASLGRRPWLGFGLCWFFLQLLPTNSLVPRLDLASERQLYLSSIGLFLVLAVAAERRWRLAPFVLAAALLPFTVLRNADYASETALWASAARLAPDKPRVLNNLGYAQALAGCTEQAAESYRRALRTDPGHSWARANLAALDRVTASPSSCPPAY